MPSSITRDSSAGSTNTHCKKLLLQKMKLVLNFRLADPIQAQRLYEAQRDLRPLHREQAEADTQHKVRTEDTVMGGYKPVIGETTEGSPRSDYSVFAWLLAHL